MVSNYLDFPGGDTMFAEYVMLDDDQDEEEQMHRIESTDELREGWREGDGENKNENMDGAGMEAFDFESADYETMSLARTLDHSRSNVDYGEQPPLPTNRNFHGIFTDVLLPGEVAAIQKKFGEIVELQDIAPPPILSVEQIMRLQAPRSFGTLQNPSGLPYRGETIVGFDRMNSDAYNRPFSDSHPILVGPQRRRALGIPIDSASNTTLPATLPDAVFSAPSHTAPETPASSPQRSRRRTISRQSVGSQSQRQFIPSPKYPCQDCDLEFDQPCALKKHAKIHQPKDRRKHVCSHCPQEAGPVTFYDLRDYHRHVFKAHPEHYRGPPPLAEWQAARCEVCGKEYSRRDGLKRHLEKREKNPETCVVQPTQMPEVVASSSSLSSPTRPQQ